MPSPVAHSIAGLAAAQLARSNRWMPSHWLWTAGLVVIANLADVDFVLWPLTHSFWFWHHGITHSIAAAILVAAIVGFVARLTRAASVRSIALLAGMVYVSHLALDFTAAEAGLATDMPLFWPFWGVYVATPIQIFAALRHHEHARSVVEFVGNFWHWENATAVAREVLVMGVVWIAVVSFHRVQLPVRAAEVRDAVDDDG